MPPQLRDYLMEVARKRPASGFVVRGQKSDHLNYDRFLKFLTKTCKQIGIPVVTAHELRHSCTELYIEMGASAEDIRRLLNHSSVDFTRRYIHRTDKRLSKIAATVEGPGDEFNAPVKGFLRVIK